MRISTALLSLLMSSLVIALAACSPPEPPVEDAEAPVTVSGFSTNPYCSNGEILCSDLPGAIIELPPGCASSNQQCSRDFWSWQNFVSLNWPGKILNAPEGVQLVEPDDSKSIGDDGNRVWELWMDPDDVFLPNAQKPSWTPGPTTSPYCTGEQTSHHRAMAGRSAKASVSFDLEDDAFFEATIQQPLIDQDLNFVVFEIRMSMDEVTWVIENDLYNKNTVDNWPTDKNIEMPGTAIETKAAWRILPESMDASQKARYYSQWANILLDPDHVEGGSGSEPICVTRELGLIGLHIRHQNLWATFEQVDNVTSSGISPTLNNPDCTDCDNNTPPTDKDGNTIPPADYKWSLEGASAALYEGFPNVPSQITHAPGQEEYIDAPMNDWWQNHVLAGTVWQHYMLITTNWTEFTSAQPIPALNTALEPYLPTYAAKYPQDCIDCHKLATNNNGVDMAQTFLVFRACPESATKGESLPPNCTPDGVDTLASN